MHSYRQRGNSRESCGMRGAGLCGFAETAMKTIALAAAQMYYEIQKYRKQDHHSPCLPVSPWPASAINSHPARKHKKRSAKGGMTPFRE